MTEINVSSNFESGNIRVLDCARPDNVRLEIREEPFTPFDNTAHFQCVYTSRVQAAG